MPSINNYPLDLTGSNPANRIVNELHEVNTNGARLFVPDAGLFYTKGFIVRNADTMVLLQPNVHYKLLQFDEEVTELASGKEVCSIVYLTEAISRVVITYQCVGDRFSNTVSALLDLIDAHPITGPVVWGQILGLPHQFNAALHKHNINKDIYGFGALIGTLEQMRMTIANGDAPAFGAVYQYILTLLADRNYVTQEQLANLSIMPPPKVYIYHNLTELRAETNMVNGDKAIYIVMSPTDPYTDWFHGRMYIWDHGKSFGDNGTTIIRPNNVAETVAGRFIADTFYDDWINWLSDQLHQEINNQGQTLSNAIFDQGQTLLNTITDQGLVLGRYPLTGTSRFITNGADVWNAQIGASFSDTLAVNRPTNYAVIRKWQESPGKDYFLGLGADGELYTAYHNWVDNIHRGWDMKAGASKLGLIPLESNYRYINNGFQLRYAGAGVWRYFSDANDKPSSTHGVVYITNVNGDYYHLSATDDDGRYFTARAYHPTGWFSGWMEFASMDTVGINTAELRANNLIGFSSTTIDGSTISRTFNFTDKTKCCMLAITSPGGNSGAGGYSDGGGGGGGGGGAYLRLWLRGRLSGYSLVLTLPSNYHINSVPGGSADTDQSAPAVSQSKYCKADIYDEYGQLVVQAYVVPGGDGGVGDPVFGGSDISYGGDGGKAGYAAVYVSPGCRLEVSEHIVNGPTGNKGYHNVNQGASPDEVGIAINAYVNNLNSGNPSKWGYGAAGVVANTAGNPGYRGYYRLFVNDI